MTKTKTRKAQIVVFYDDKGRYISAGDWTCGKQPTKDTLIARLGSICDDLDIDTDELPYTCSVDIELPDPELEGKVIRVKKVSKP